MMLTLLSRKIKTVLITFYVTKDSQSWIPHQMVDSQNMEAIKNSCMLLMEKSSTMNKSNKNSVKTIISMELVIVKPLEYYTKNMENKNSVTISKVCSESLFMIWKTTLSSLLEIILVLFLCM